MKNIFKAKAEEKIEAKVADYRAGLKDANPNLTDEQLNTKAAEYRTVITKEAKDEALAKGKKLAKIVGYVGAGAAAGAGIAAVVTQAKAAKEQSYENTLETAATTEVPMYTIPEYPDGPMAGLSVPVEQTTSATYDADMTDDFVEAIEQV